MYSKNTLPPPSNCPNCNEKRYRLPNGRPRCSDCDSKRAKGYHGRNQEKHKERVKGYYQENKDRWREYEEYNKEKIAAYKKEYAKTHRSAYLEKQHPLYQIWQGIQQRCTNPNRDDYRYYGGRGIKRCRRWNNFDNFVIDMPPRPSPEHSIDRIDVDGDYEPGNVRWLTHKEQMNNTRRNVRYRLNTPDISLIYYNQKTMTIVEFGELIKMPLMIVRYRYAQGLDADHILHYDYDNRYYEWRGHKYNMAELSLLSGINYSTMSSRIRKHNWSVNEAMITPVSAK